MAYGTKATIKTMLGMDSEVYTHDDALDKYIGQADDWIDTQLRPWVSVPMGSPPDMIIAASDWITCGYFLLSRPQRHGTEDERAKEMIEVGKDMVNEYIQGFHSGQESPGTWNASISSGGPRGTIHSLESEYVERDDI